MACATRTSSLLVIVSLLVLISFANVSAEARTSSDDLAGALHGARKLLGRAAPPPPAPASRPPYSASAALPPPPPAAI
ncbi:hypothetical protein GQ55_5G492900 [Panicum hallii var. hallii]|uniref:Uncharacterized protein n=2 Tax=Panicum hallii TaxID=206008 RepID=A0A2T7DRM2_9POAL|nr:hypothetical protein GQ55_5G492900 [Panicum hallii var. hallii]PVH39379.1 hypothetical protein PAHAL_5G488000 [Panicum hallii]